MPKFGYVGSKFLKTNVRFEIRIFKIRYIENFIEKLESWYFFDQNTKIWTFVQEVWKAKLSIKFQSSLILKFWVISDHFTVFGGTFWLNFESFWLALPRFGWFRVLVSTKLQIHISVWIRNRLLTMR